MPVKCNKLGKQKRRTFAEQASKTKDFIPAADAYHLDIDWAKSPTTRNCKFDKNPRRTVADDIIKKSEKKETTSPGPTAYHEYDTWKTKISPRIKGNYKNTGERVTFANERQWFAGQSPGFKYGNVKVTSYKEKKAPKAFISAGEARFNYLKQEKLEDLPGPTSY